VASTVMAGTLLSSISKMLSSKISPRQSNNLIALSRLALPMSNYSTSTPPRMIFHLFSWLPSPCKKAPAIPTKSVALGSKF
jgi:hypothetical protein